jgi:hypothetical protein
VLVKGITSKRVGAGVGLAVDPVVDPNDGLVIGPSTCPNDRLLAVDPVTSNAVMPSQDCSPSQDLKLGPQRSCEAVSGRELVKMSGRVKTEFKSGTLRCEMEAAFKVPIGIAMTDVAPWSLLERGVESSVSTVGIISVGSLKVAGIRSGISSAIGIEGAVGVVPLT